jgi:type IV pilus assembly protein PilQ
MTTRRLLLVALCVLSTAIVRGQADPAADGATGTVSVSENKDLISVDFPNEEIRVVLRNVADLFELNLVVPETLVGRTSVKLRNVTWRQIFEVVLAQENYTYIEEGNIIKIVSRDQLSLEPTTTDVYVLNYSRASEILPTISAMVDTSETVRGRIQIDARNNALVITERPTQLKKIKPIIDQLDVATAQVMIETKFIEVTNNDQSDIGVNWASLSNYRIGTEGPITATSQHVTNVNTTTGLVTYEEGIIGRNLGNAVSQLFSAPHLVESVFTAGEFSVLLSLLEGQENVRLVSNPTVVTLNNVLAKINVGEEFPIPNYTYNQERGNFEISGFTYKAIGIILNVTPQVNNAGFIKLAITPEVSSRTGTVNFGGASGASIPIIAVRKTETQVSLKNGHTMGIGGLIESTNIKGTSRVPVFGELPLIGGLFKSKNNSKTSRNLVVFITAKTLDNETPAVEEIFDAQSIRDMELRRSDLPGHRAPGSAFPE